MISDDELLEMDRSQLLREMQEAEKIGDDQKTQELRQLLMRQHTLLNSLNMEELSNLVWELEKQKSNDWEKSRIVLKRLKEFEDEEQISISRLLKEKPTPEEKQAELLRAAKMIAGLTGTDISNGYNWDELYNELSQIDSPYIESALAAVNWWEEKLTNPDKEEFYNTGNEDVNNKIMSIPITPSPIKEEMKPLFRAYLLIRILRVMEFNMEHACSVGTDYEPQGLLHDVMILSGLRSTDFPIKEGTYVEKDRVTVSGMNINEVIFSKENSIGQSK